jgi:hypothetical protein
VSVVLDLSSNFSVSQDGTFSSGWHDSGIIALTLDFSLSTDYFGWTDFNESIVWLLTADFSSSIGRVSATLDCSAISIVSLDFSFSME